MQSGKAEPEDLECKVNFPMLCRAGTKARWKTTSQTTKIYVVPNITDRYSFPQDTADSWQGEMKK